MTYFAPGFVEVTDERSDDEHYHRQVLAPSNRIAARELSGTPA